MNPPLCFTMPYTVASPRPVPLPFSLVVKNGSNRWACVTGSMPVPVSLTASIVYLPGGAVRRLVNLLGILAPRVVGSQILEEQVGVPRDGGEDVVEVMRDPAGQSSHGLHLLRLAELLLQLDSLGDVPADPEDADQPVVAQLRGGGELGEAIVAPDGVYAELGGRSRLPPHHPAEQLEGERQVFRVHELVERLAEPLATGRTGDRFERGIEGGDDPVG